MAQTRLGCRAGLVLAALAASALPTGALAQAQAEQAAEEDRFLASEDGWDTYVNGRFGMRLVYPGAVFVPAAAPPEGDGRRFEADDARIEVSAWRNEAEVTPSELASRLTEAEGYRQFIWHEVEEARLVVAGYRADRVFYEEYRFEGATVQALGMEYPAARRATYDPLLKQIAALFLPAAEAGADEPAEEPGEPPRLVARPADPQRPGEAQETVRQAPEPDETEAAAAAQPEIVEEPAAEPPAQPAAEPAAQPAAAPPVEAAAEPRARPDGRQQETTPPVRRTQVAGSRGEGGGSSSEAGGSSSEAGGSEGGEDGDGGNAGGAGSEGGGGDGGEGGGDGDGGEG